MSKWRKDKLGCYLVHVYDRREGDPVIVYAKTADELLEWAKDNWTSMTGEAFDDILIESKRLVIWYDNNTKWDSIEFDRVDNQTYWKVGLNI